MLGMMNKVRSFSELAPEQQAAAGGKGGMLARLFQEGYPVPEGFVVLAPAFQDEKLDSQVWSQVQAHLHSLRQNQKEVRFAVRSSALSEDSAQASFAGEFETVLNVTSDQEILEAIHTVYQSRQAERVRVYSAAHDMEVSQQMAVVIQRMVPSELAGVLFTADPVSGSYTNMIGNFAHGLGEQLVSGEANAYAFKLIRPKGQCDGPDEVKPYASELYKYAMRLEKELGSPQDI